MQACTSSRRSVEALALTTLCVSMHRLLPCLHEAIGNCLSQAGTLRRISVKALAPHDTMLAAAGDRVDEEAPAHLMNAIVFMPDEPTSNVDVNNIKWLEEWLGSLSGSAACTSHFPPSLGKLCTHIIVLVVGKM